ncbi:translationally-controlled tumor protein homolog [Gouania willdenowi]|uniref:Translationally-controlled tumor protein homolog n=1 Tax=Gouania willdenowi TaxID=441366 RepID=A0A8C5DVG4_GOUWI|nr:translationally-controlled tumor protein [Gouania willdenowi]
MIIYKCLISGDEMFSDIYTIKETDDGFLYEVEGKMVTRREGEIDDSMIGGNASSEGPSEGMDECTITGVDIVLNHKLQETPFDKKSYLAYIKDYMKAIKAKLQVINPDRVEKFQTTAPIVMKRIVSNINNYQFFTGENMNVEGMVALLDYRPDGITPFLTFFKDGLELEKF